MQGPRWLGIGAQRSGTDWVSRLLTQHPKVDFGTNGVKEQQWLQNVVLGRKPLDQYLEWFPDDGVFRGEWSPRYMPSASVPHLAREVVADDAPIFVLLRDPIERFASGIRYGLKRRKGKADRQVDAETVIRAHQLGQYASCLESWATAFPKERIVVMTYEQAKEDIQKACEIFWGAMGLDPHPLTDPHARVKPSTEGAFDWEFPPGMREALAAHYLPQVLWLRDHWGIDVSRWRSFQGLI